MIKYLMEYCYIREVLSALNPFAKRTGHLYVLASLACWIVPILPLSLFIFNYAEKNIPPDLFIVKRPKGEQITRDVLFPWLAPFLHWKGYQSHIIGIRVYISTPQNAQWHKMTEKEEENQSQIIKGIIVGPYAYLVLDTVPPPSWF